MESLTSQQHQPTSPISKHMHVDNSNIAAGTFGTQPLEASSADSRPNSPDSQQSGSAMRTRRATRNANITEEAASEDPDTGGEGEALHRAVPSRSRSLRERKQSDANQAVNPRLANHRSRAEWKQSAAQSHQPPSLDQPHDEPTTEDLPVAPKIESDRQSPTSPRGTTRAVGMPPLSADLPAEGPLELPAPIPPHPYTFIPHLPLPLQSPPQPPDYPQPSLSGSVGSARPLPRAIAPRTTPHSPPTGSTSPSQSTIANAGGSGGANTSRPHVCPLCTLAFARAHDLKRHSTTHTGEKRFKCPSCGKAYGRKDALKRHACAAGTAHAAATAMYQQATAIVNGGLEPVTGMQEEGAPVLVTLPGPTTGPPPLPGMLYGRSRGQLQAPPIVGAAATMLGPPRAPPGHVPPTPAEEEEDEEEDAAGEPVPPTGEGIKEGADNEGGEGSSESLEDPQVSATP